MKSNDIRLPDVEVRITASAFDVFCMSIYAGPKITDEVEVVTAVTGKHDCVALRQILSLALKALDGEDWVTLDEIDPRSAQNEKRPPF